MIVLLIISLVISVASLVAFFVVMKVLFDQQKQQFAINKRCKELDNNLKPIRLNFGDYIQLYTIYIKQKSDND